MRRIVLGVALLALLAGPLWAQAGAEDAVAAVLMMQNQTLATLDLTLPGARSGPDVDRDLRELERWTGWVLGTPQVKSLGQDTACQVAITSGGIVEGALNDAIWPVVAALASHGRINITVIGAPVTTAAVTIENRFVRMVQGGGQGVQSYDVQIKDAGFRTVEELRTPEAVGGNNAAPQRRGFGGAWLLLIVAAAAVGVAVYLITRGLAATPRTGRRRR